uniref:Cyclin-like domain-containing protein n=1 Tax=Timema monikensis TaxID=170555 RepID=A0A7R9HSG0_9NEOP|nr:unnamed protein product [Timema monikensis]
MDRDGNKCDPCLYILRFANRLEFGDKTHEVSMTALRLVQRMKRDCIHSGRRPSGLCGAALLMAARLHEFNRTVGDIIKIVKVHESTLKKRLIEFGETPSSSLTLDEFMTVDLEEEQDPPSFKAARKKDKERLAKMMEDENVDDSFNELQREIEMELEEKARGKKRPRNIISRDYDEPDPETVDTNRFITQSTLGVIHGCLVNDGVVITPETTTHPSTSTGLVIMRIYMKLRPNMATMGLSSSLNEQTVTTTTEDTPSAPDNGEIDLMGIDEDEIDSYIMTEQESKNKDVLWMKINESYLKDKKEKEEKLAKEREEGKPEKKKRKPPKKKNSQPANSAGEAIEKMLQEKKISSKINYDVLKSLSVRPIDSFKPPPKDITTDSNSSASTLSADIPSEPSSSSDPVITSARMSRMGPRLDAEPRKPKTAPSIGLPLVTSEEQTTVPPVIEILPDPELEDDEEYEDEVEPENNDEVSLSQMLNQHRDDDYYGGYDEDEF